MKCPECKTPLTNESSCDHCKWRKKTRPINSSAKRTTEVEIRSCSGYMPNGAPCGAEPSVKHNQQWWCSSCHQSMREGVAKSNDGSHKVHLDKIMAILQNAKGPMASSMKTGFAEVLVQEEPGANG